MFKRSIFFTSLRFFGKACSMFLSFFFLFIFSLLFLFLFTFYVLVKRRRFILSQSCFSALSALSHTSNRMVLILHRDILSRHIIFDVHACVVPILSTPLRRQAQQVSIIAIFRPIFFFFTGLNVNFTGTVSGAGGKDDVQDEGCL